ncbi:D-cysteine desulfhydrase [Pseudomonas protegens]|jgi:D-cysteine desulfhydrase|uniref:L-cysteate sulfo-lyase n=3 Tax=Pseudomonas protegens TaxID=380021 RepID=Q4KK38_PSEF5|nr:MULTISPECIES: D-cysteine desulfhydrase [Pseudomonas]AAY95661.1 D-cysteine desulfhydrase [Pseudomonas protegens Pf-5]AGL82052.1 D-cysteine desulfhydrase DcyD [Pseudomonas protegens CHA0]ASE20200.1 D-cysteine desulfhydrase [Pseudomonas protegens]MBB1613593.1 D-cysteine desulfhydrase [Pseudomonas sp. UMC65]MBB1619527.1 D-cysteine desulfhydrase [Pseudomonas sp. UME65]
MIKQQLARFNRLDLLRSTTALEKLERLSAWIGRDVYVKRDDSTPLAMGGNKLRKLEYLAADALAQGADTLITAGAIQSNHVRQTAALAAKLGLGCVALLENPTGTQDPNYLGNGNRLLLDLFDAKVELVENLDQADEQLHALAARLRSNGKKPYLVPIGGSNALGALGYVRAGLELAQQIEDSGLEFAAVVLASGSAGTHSGLALALSEVLPQLPVIGVTVSRSEEDQRPKVQGLAERTAELLGVKLPDAFNVQLWDEYFAPRYGEPNAGTLAAVKLLASQEGLLLDPVYTGKAMAGLLDGVGRQRFDDGPLIFLHTGGAPALFAYAGAFS